VNLRHQETKSPKIDQRSTPPSSPKPTQGLKQVPSTQILTAFLLLAGSITGLTFLVLVLQRRSSAAQQQLSQESHDRALALSQRADHLQAQVDRLRLDQRIDRLGNWVELAERRQLLPAAAAQRLHHHLLRLADEAGSL